MEELFNKVLVTLKNETTVGELKTYKFVHENTLSNLMEWYSPISNVPVDAEQFIMATDNIDCLLKILEKFYDASSLCTDIAEELGDECLFTIVNGVITHKQGETDSVQQCIETMRKYYLDEESDNYWSSN